MTDAMAAGRFPTDEPLNELGHRQVDAAIELGSPSAGVLRSGEAHPPDRRAARPAAETDSRLADLDCGRWRGDVLGGVRPPNWRSG